MRTKAGVKNQRPKWFGKLATRSRYPLNHGPQNFADPLSSKSGNPQKFPLDSQIPQLLLGLFDSRQRGIDFVNDADHRQTKLARLFQVGKRLGLDSLGCIHQKEGALARRQRARYLVGKIGVAGGVNHVEGIGFSV